MPIIRASATMEPLNLDISKNGDALETFDKFIEAFIPVGATINRITVEYYEEM